MVYDNNEFKEFVFRQLKELGELFKAKNEQYSNGDALANFSTGAALRTGGIIYGEETAELNKLVLMFEEAKAYQRKHIAFVTNSCVSTPKIEESLKDIAIYSLIQLYMVEKFKEAAKSLNERGKQNEL